MSLARTGRAIKGNSVNARVAVVVLMMLIACTSIKSFAEERTVRVAADPYPPWAVGEAGSKPTGGIVVEIVEE